MRNLHPYSGRTLLLYVISFFAVRPAVAQPDPLPALKSVFQEAFRIGAALNPSQITGRAAGETALARSHFNSVTPENTMKWENIHPKPDTYAFSTADRFVEFGTQNKMHIVGHTLVWHSQTPDWVFEAEDGSRASRETLIERLRNHIHTVVNRYEDRIDAWDVVNEAVLNDGRLRQSPWLEIIGKEYIALAFEFAREADPDADLYYNDYTLTNRTKRARTVEMVKWLQGEDVPITGVGLQSHHRLNSPSVAQQDSAITAFAELGVDVMITELDIAVLPRPSNPAGEEVSARYQGSEKYNPYPDALPDSMQQALARRYGDLFEVFLKHRDDMSRVAFWGVTDTDSWLNDWPISGRTSYPLLFDRDNRPKPAFDAVIQTAREAGLWTPPKTE